ncbi:MAG: Ig-like domain-containing protein, partial [Oscillospiraceae bacterium]|nr:Ig-like domain-containing protein [Oscillospiraceae bacterium]
GVQGIRVAQPGLTSFNRTGDYSGNQGFAIKFDVPETGVYDVSAEISIGPTCGYVDAYLIEGSTKTYIGSYDSWDASNSYPLSSVKLLSVSLEAGKDYSLMFYHSSSGAVDDRVYLKKIFFDPVKEPSEVVGVDAYVDDNNLAAGESVELIAAAKTSNGVIYEIEKSKRNADGGLSITYRSSDENIATVSDTGVIKAKTPGKVNITAEIELPNGTVSKDVQITVNENTYASAGVNIEEDSIYIVGGSQKLIPSAILSDGSSAALRDITARYESDNESVAKIEDGKLVAVAEGSANITSFVTFNGVEKSVTRKINVENVKLAGIEAKTAADRVSALDMSGSQINVTGVLNNGEKINLADAVFSFESLTPEIVFVDENGVAYYVTRGIGTVKVSAEIDGNVFECECEVISSSQKKGPTIYTEEMRAQALVNAKKYSWARDLVEKATTEADVFVQNLDAIYDMIPVEGVPRASGMATWNASADYEYVCPYCKVNLQEKYGTKPWVIDPLENPWKVQCPDCKNLFPSNDFESFYKLGITEDGVFDRELALKRNQEIVDAGGEGYLVNKLHTNVGTVLGVDADKVSTWMVDDGFGWSDVDGTYGTKTLPKFNPAAHYAHLFWDSNGTDGSFFTRGLRALRDAYLYTGDAKYGRAGVILLDRVADVYPDFHLAKVSLNYPNSHGLGYNGKVVGQIWETNVLDVF